MIDDETFAWLFVVLMLLAGTVADCEPAPATTPAASTCCEAP